MEKEIATHSSVLDWRIPEMGEPGGLPSVGSHRVGHDWSDLAAAAKINKLLIGTWCNWNIHQQPYICIKLDLFVCLINGWKLKTMS